MLLFHASQSNFVDGQVITAPPPTTFYPEAVAALESQRPAAAPSRSICFFASDSVMFATFFLLRQNVPHAQIRLYEVEMPVSWKAPMALVHTLSKRLQKAEDGLTIVTEYWNPTMKWQFYEVFGPEMTIKKRLVTPIVEENIFFCNYLGDVDHAEKL